jgi:3-deoxy-D-manno-octulosonate 8-phosphate phosphatase KdsC-like HAD superfamily phosphatase
MNASRFIAVSALSVLAAVSSIAAQADEADGSQYAVQVTSQRTRAEVKAEAIAAVGDRSQDLAALGVVSVQSKATRADVRAQAAQALRLGKIPSGEASSL